MFGFSKKKDNEFKELAEPAREAEAFSNLKYIDEVENLKKLKESPEIILEVLNEIVQDYLRKKYHIKKGADYSELIEVFKEKNNPILSDFCTKMTESSYSGEKLTRDKVSDLIWDFERIIQEEEPKKKIIGHDPFSKMMKKIGIFEKEKIQTDQFLSKKAKKMIYSKLTAKKEEKNANQINEIVKEDKEEPSGDLSKKPEVDLLSEDQEESKEELAINSIDNLERIKAKIQERKSQLNT